MPKELKVRAECPHCGSLDLTPAQLRCAVDPRSKLLGLCEYHCPICSQLIVVPTTATAATAMLGDGAGTIAGAVPFELLEEHSGPPLTTDDFLDFYLALESTRSLP